jgi:hypothetical protein
MLHSIDRVIHEHPRTGESHHDFYLLAVFWFIAVDWTVRAGSFILPKAAERQPF